MGCDVTVKEMEESIPYNKVRKVMMLHACIVLNSSAQLLAHNSEAYRC